MKEIQHDEQLYSTELKYIKEGVYFVDTERRISFWNYWAEHITGFSSSQVLGSFCQDNLLNHVDEEGIPMRKMDVSCSGRWMTD